MIKPTKKLERKFLKSGFRNIIGVDEVGVGCLAGPVVVCAVSIPVDFYNKRRKNLNLVRDSKLLNSKQRSALAKEILNIKNIKYKICYCYPQTIDRQNIYLAARLAMRRAVTKCALGCVSPVVLIDGPYKIKGLNVEQKAVIKGDQKVFTIACASILAKVYRDKMMARYAKKYPGYGFEINKGYGTKHHYAQLASLGPSPIHRRSFRLV